MKTHGWFLLGLLASGTVLAAETPATSSSADDAAVPTAQTTQPAPGTPEWRIGYTLGFSLGQRMLGDIPELNTEAFRDGFSDAYAKQAGKLTPDQMQAAFGQFQEERVARLQEAHRKMLADNLAKADAFLTTNAKRKGVKKTKSGLQYEVLKKGKGGKPSANDIVIAHYRGTLIDGTEFDSTAGGDPAEFPLDRVIAGWKEGVGMMNRGAKYKFYLPPQLGYGEQGVGEGDVIGPNQALVFEVELIDFRAAPQPEEQPDAQSEPAAPDLGPAPVAEPL